ncbi:hypothetical protein [Micromonospora sp. NPDC023956]|uniref:hypothetical protein n=1 Tax=Micromonospora sp. NPDC023956 TaxID=3155722 RepID=UPI0033CCFCF7
MAGSRPFRTLIVGLLGCVLALVPAPPASAGPDPAGPGPVALDQEMRSYLAWHPGGTPINADEISYDGGAFVVTLRRPVGTYGADCPSGWFCFYDWPYYGYPRGRLSSCGKQNLANWGWQYRAASAHYNLASGSVTFQYHDSSLFSVSVKARVVGDAGPYRDWANYVYRRC